MDLDDLRVALDEAAQRRVPDDVSGARAVVGARAQRTRRRQRGIASAVLLGGAIAAIAIVLAIAGSGSSRPAPAVVPQPPLTYAPLPARSDASMTYDDAHGEVVLFGGAVAPNRALDETWLWDGHGWARAHPKVTPPAREGAVMAYDPSTRTVLMFGGLVWRANYTSQSFDDLWSWNGVNWTRLQPRHEPPRSTGLAMSYDPASKSVILLTGSGHSVTGPTRFRTWRWDGSDWHELSTPTAPTFSAGASVYNLPLLVPSTHGLLFYSWALDSSVCPPPDEQCSGPPDVNGLRWSHTWTWDGHGWTEQHPSRAPGGVDLVASFDGTPTAFAVSPWKWTGTDWNDTGATRGLGPGIGSAVWDAKDRVVVVYDGSETWTWNGTWVRREVAPVPTTVRPPGGIPVCGSPQLRLSLDRQLQSLMQQPGAYFALTNTAATACALDGYPELIIYDAAGNPIRATMQRGSSFQINDPGAHRVVVQPGASVYFGFGWSNANQSAGGSTQGCSSIASVAATGPGTGASLRADAHLDQVFCPPNGFVSAIALKGAFTPSSP